MVDAARAAGESDRFVRAEALADGLKAAYDGGGAFATLLDAVWPEVLFGPAARRTRNFVGGTVHGNVIQARTLGSIKISNSSGEQSAPSSPARSRFRFFGAPKRQP